MRVPACNAAPWFANTRYFCNMKRVYVFAHEKRFAQKVVYYASGSMMWIVGGIVQLMRARLCLKCVRRALVSMAADTS